MKIKHLIMVCLILAIFTIGAVSAADDAGNLTADDAQGDAVQQAPEDDGVLEDPTDEYEKSIIVPEEIVMMGGKFYGHASVSLPNDATGNVSAYLDDDDVPFYNEEYHDYAEIYFHDLPLTFSNHTLKLNYTGDSNYTGFQNTYKFNATYDLTFQKETSLLWGENVTIDVGVPDDIEGNVTFLMNGKYYQFTTDDSPWYGYLLYEFALSDLNFGVNNFTISVSNDPKYPNKSFNGTITVYSAILIEYPNWMWGDSMRYGDDGNITLVLPEDAKGTLNVTIDGKHVADVTSSDGRFSIPFAGLDVGKHTISANYTGSDYYVEAIENPEFSVVPFVSVPKLLYYQDKENSIITVKLNDNASEVLNITIREDDTFDSDYEELLYSKIANGTVIVNLPELGGGRGYYVYVTYGDETVRYEGRPYFRLEVRSDDPNYKLNLTFPDNVTVGSVAKIIVHNFPYDANYNFMIYVNGVSSAWWYDQYDNLEIPTEVMLFGENNVTVVFEDTAGYYNTTSATGKVTMELCGLPAEVMSEDRVYMDLDERKGFIDLKIDGKHYACELLIDGSASIDIEGLSLGTHTYELAYYDENNVKKAVKSGSFNIIYEIRTNIYSEHPLVKEFDLRVYVPEDADGTVAVSVDGKNYTAKPVDGVARIVLEGLVMGENNVSISLVGDSKYPVREIKRVINIEGYGFDIKANDSALESISLLLPEDAKGNITVYNAHYVDAHYDDYGEWVAGEYVVDEAITSVKLENGYAKVSNLEFTLGKHAILARYENDDDYTVPDEVFEFTNLPELHVDEDVIAGENASVSVELQGATGNVTVYRWYDDDWQKLTAIPVVEGKAQGNITLPLGNYNIKLDYEGDDLSEPFGPEGYEFYLDVNPKKVEIPEKFSADGSGEIIFELPEGIAGKVSVYEEFDDERPDAVLIEDAVYTSDNKTIAISGLSTGYRCLILEFTDDATGEKYSASGEVFVPKPDAGENVTIPDTISGDTLDISLPKNATGGVFVTIDGETTFMPLVNGTVKVDASKLAEGAHTITVKYPGDETYAGFEKTVNVTVKKPVEPKITADNFNTIYSAGAKYSVTVYGTDGNVAANVAVTFLINGKVFKTVKTDSKGVASIVITQTPGSYKITTQALGKSVTKTLTVKHVLKLQKVKVKRSAKKLVIKVTLAKVNGKYLKGKKITLKFKGKKYTAKTNKKGVAKFTIKKNVLKKLKKGKKVTYQATYLKDTVKYTVKVKK